MRYDYDYDYDECMTEQEELPHRRHSIQVYGDFCYAHGKDKIVSNFFFSATLAAFRVPTAIRGGIIVAESSFHCCRFRSHSRLNVCVANVISSRRHEQTIENVRFNLKLLDLESKKESAQPLFMKIYFVFYVLAQNTYTKVRIDVSITWFVIFF